MKSQITKLRSTVPRHVLIVCSSNVCRSPYGEFHLKRLIDNSPVLKKRVIVESAAVFNQSREIFPKTRDLLIEEGFDEMRVLGHKPRYKRSIPNVFQSADLIVGMTKSHRFWTPRKHRDKFITLSELARGKYEKIPDPFLTKEMHAYRKTVEPIKTYLEEAVALWEGLTT